MTKSEKNNGANHNKGHGNGSGKGKNKGGGYGVGGYCVCAKCGAKVEHQQGIKCTTLKCPECGHTMVREELLNDNLSKD